MDKIVKEGLTFDDVLLIPAKSDVVPKDVSLKTRLTANIELNIPLVSAAMDTVTESKLAIAIAREGGLGIIHKNMTIDEQVEQVDKVKRSENGVINDPFSLSRDHKLTDALALMQKYRISAAYPSPRKTASSSAYLPTAISVSKPISTAPSTRL